MTRSLVSVDFATTVYQVAMMMEKGGLGAIIVKKDDLPEGIITDRDFATKIAVQKHSLDTPVHMIASFPIQTIDSGRSILDAAEIMVAKKIRKLVAVEGDRVVGIITSTDLVKQMAQLKYLS